MRPLKVYLLLYILQFSHIVQLQGFRPSQFNVVLPRPRTNTAFANIISKHKAVEKGEGSPPVENNDKHSWDDDEDDDESGTTDLNMAAFKARKKERNESMKEQQQKEFDGYALRDVIYDKWGYCYDVDFNRVDSFGFRRLYLNVLPFHLGGRRWRHESEMDYLCHLQAVVEILEKYGQLDNILAQIEETNKKPRAGTVPIVAVPLRLDLTPEQVKEIIGY